MSWTWCERSTNGRDCSSILQQQRHQSQDCIHCPSPAAEGRDDGHLIPIGEPSLFIGSDVLLVERKDTRLHDTLQPWVRHDDGVKENLCVGALPQLKQLLAGSSYLTASGKV